MSERVACPPGEELSAYALGEGTGAQRASLARHLLACTPCRAACEADLQLVLGLRALGAAHAAPGRQPAAPARVVQRAGAARRWLALLPPVAAALLVGATLLAPSAPAPVPASRAPAAPGDAAARAQALPAHLQHLLATQRRDGSWPGEAGVAGADDRTATALALLALDTAQGPVAEAAARDDVRSARARGLARLSLEVGPTGAGLRHGALPLHALLLAALCGPGAAQLAPQAAPAAASLVHALGSRTHDLARDPASLAWAAYAVQRAEASAVPGVERLREGLPRASLAPPDAAPAATLASWPASPGLAGSAQGVPCTPLRTALEVLAGEPPLRGLALGPACRLPLLARAP